MSKHKQPREGLTWRNTDRYIYVRSTFLHSAVEEREEAIAIKSKDGEAT